MLLSADLAGVFQNQIALLPGGLHIAELEHARTADDLALFVRLDRIGDDLQLFNLNADFLARLAGQLRGLGHDHRHRLADEMHFIAGQQLFVRNDRPDLILAGDVRCREHGHHAFRCQRRADIQLYNLPVRHRRAEHRRMQQIRRPRQVVHILRLAARVRNGIEIHERFISFSACFAPLALAAVMIAIIAIHTHPSL